MCSRQQDKCLGLHPNSKIGSTPTPARTLSSTDTLTCPRESTSSSGSSTRLVREKCCKDQIKAEIPDRYLISSDIGRDIIIGLSDGLMVPFALTAGLSSLGSSKLVYQGGFAELMAGAISMGIGGYLSAKGEQDIFRHRRSAIGKRLNISCGAAIKGDVYDILKPFGVGKEVSSLLAEGLEKAEKDAAIQDEIIHPSVNEEKETSRVRCIARRVTNAVKSDSTSVGDRGTLAFLMQFGEGLESVPTSRLWLSAWTIGLSYFVGGLIPIIPYLCVSDALSGLYWSILATGIILIVFGGSKAWLTGAAAGWRGVIWGAISMVAVGAASAGAAYGLVRALASHGD